MMLNNIEMTSEEENAMHVAAKFLESVRAGATVTCGDLADYLAASFPDIAPQPKPLSRPGARETNWDLHFSDPLRAAETIAKLKESLYGGEVSNESSGDSDPESYLLDWLNSPADESLAALIDHFVQGGAL